MRIYDITYESLRSDSCLNNLISAVEADIIKKEKEKKESSQAYCMWDFKNNFKNILKRILN